MSEAKVVGSYEITHQPAVGSDALATAMTIGPDLNAARGGGHWERRLAPSASVTLVSNWTC